MRGAFWNTFVRFGIQAKQKISVLRALTNKLHSVKHLDDWQRLQHLDLMSSQRRRERNIYIILQVLKIRNEKSPSPNDVGIQFCHASAIQSWDEGQNSIDL